MTVGQKTAESLKPARGRITLAPAFDLTLPLKQVQLLRE